MRDDRNNGAIERNYHGGLRPLFAEVKRQEVIRWVISDGACAPRIGA